MTKQRMIELLEIEHECMLRKSHDICDGNCCVCELVQDDYELHEMYINVISTLKAQEQVEPIPWLWDRDIQLYKCGACGGEIGAGGIAKYCFHCGRGVKWE